MNVNELPSRLLHLLDLQEYVLTREQILAAGVPRSTLQRMVARGQFRRLAHGVYTTAPDDTWRRRAWAGVLYGGDEAVIGQEAARHLHELGPAPPDIAIWVGRHRWIEQQPGFQFIRAHRRGTGLLPRTRVEDTILDLASLVDSDGLCRLIADAVSARKTSAAQLRRALEARPVQAQRALINDLVTEVGHGVRSPLERRYLHNVERAHGLPVGRRQWRDGDGLHCDVGYDEGLLVELDGATYHRGSRLFDDMNRDNRHVLTGRPTFRFGWPHATTWACQSARLVNATLQRLGRRERGHSCAQCRRRPFESLAG